MSLPREAAIGIVTWDFLNPKGGMGRSLRHIAGLLTSKTVRIASPIPPADQKPLLRFTNKFGKHLLFSLLLPFTLSGWIKREKIRLLLCPVGPGGIFLLRKATVPMIAIVYHTYHQQSRLVPGQQWKKIFLPLEKMTLRRAARIICFAEDSKRALIDCYHIPEDHIDLCAHPLDINAWQVSKRKDPLACVCVSRLEARKGVDVLLKAWEIVQKSAPQATLTLIGRGVLSAMIDTTISHAKNIRRIEHCSQAELVGYVSGASIALCPSYLEGFGCAAAEAMACECAVVATNTDGLRSLVAHGKTGMLFERGDARALADAIIRLLIHPEYSRQLGSSARSFIADHCDNEKARNDILHSIDSTARDESIVVT